MLSLDIPRLVRFPLSFPAFPTRLPRYLHLKWRRGSWVPPGRRLCTQTLFACGRQDEAPFAAPQPPVTELTSVFTDFRRELQHVLTSKATSSGGCCGFSIRRVVVLLDIFLATILTGCSALLGPARFCCPPTLPERGLDIASPRFKERCALGVGEVAKKPGQRLF